MQFHFFIIFEREKKKKGKVNIPQLRKNSASVAFLPMVY